MFKKNPEREAMVAKLSDFLAGIPDGEEVSWIRIEAGTGVKMNTAGRNAARRALDKLKRPYEAVHGTAVRLSSPATAMDIARTKFLRIDGAVRVADKTQKDLAARHLEKMSPDEQRKLIMMGAFFGAVRAIAKQNAVLILKGPAAAAA